MERKLYFSISVWGKEYVETFLKFSLPFLLTPGNLLAFLHEVKTTVVFATDKASLPLVQNDSNFQKLLSLFNVIFIEIPSNVFSQDKYSAVSYCQDLVLRLAAETNDPILFHFPDHILSENSLKKILQLWKEGKRVILAATPRLTKETFCERLQAKALPEKGSGISSRDLVALACDHLHPISKSLFWKGKKINQWPSHIYWDLSPKNFLARGFHLHPFFVWPENVDANMAETTVDGLFLSRACPSPQYWHIIEDSDDFLAFEMSSLALGKNLRYFAKNSSQVSYWARGTTTKQHRYFFTTPIIFHSAPVEKKWDKKISGSKKIAGRICRQLEKPNYLTCFLWLILNCIDKNRSYFNRLERIFSFLKNLRRRIKPLGYCESSDNFF